MKKISKILLLILVTLSVSSCVTSKKCNRKFPPEIIIKESIHTNTVVEYRDTIIYTPGDTVYFTDSINCDPAGRVNMAPRTVTSNNASVTVSIRNNELNVVAQCDSLEIEIERLNKYINTSKTRSIVKTIIKKEKYIPSFYQFTFWWFFLTIAIVGGRFALKKFTGGIL